MKISQVTRRDIVDAIVTEKISWKGLIGRQLFAIDGVKLPGNAAKARSGTRKEFPREARKMGRAVRRMLACHRQEDLPRTCEPSLRTRETRQVDRLKQGAEQIRPWLQAHPEDRRGVRGGLFGTEATTLSGTKVFPAPGDRLQRLSLANCKEVFLQLR
jgi:hypothetical protein